MIRPLARNDVVLVNFPFTDSAGDKMRPALIVGRDTQRDVTVAFITSRTTEFSSSNECVLHQSDPEFRDTGLRTASLVRLDKLATLHRSIVRRRLGRIGQRTQDSIDKALRYCLQLD